MGKHVKFTEDGVVDKRGGSLGTIEWYDDWRCHIFVPDDNTVYSWDCLRDIRVELQQRDRSKRR